MNDTGAIAIAAPKKVVGRYALHEEIASGGMATVHFGRLLGPVGFARTVAIKRLHPQFSKDPEFVSMFLDEARLAARIRHPNVVPTLDVVATEGELFLVMDYVNGESLSRLMRTARAAGMKIDQRIVSSIMSGALAGLHAAHEAKSERGEPLKIVHRDVSPQNILVGQDGIARVLDFGVAKAVGRMATTATGQVKGKLAYMAPEQLHGKATRQSDIFAAAIVFWEVLAGKRLFTGDSEGELLYGVLSAPISPPSSVEPAAAPFDEIVMRGLERDPAKRFATAREMALAIERVVAPASPHEVGEWVEKMAQSSLHKRAQQIAEIESGSTAGRPGDPKELETKSQDVPIEPLQSAAPEMPTVAAKIEAEPRRRGGLVIAAVAIVVVAAIAIVAVFPRKATQPEPAPMPAKSAEVAPFAAVSASTSAPPIVPSASVSVAPSVSSSAPPPPKPTVAKPKAAAANSQSPRPASGGSANCDPPYTLDAAGRKKWKPECVGN